jgi:RNA polymerase sigma factor (sigma-70 family)
LKADSEYVEGLKRNVEKEHAAFVHQFAPVIYNTAIHILQHKEEAEEVAQDVFMKIFQSIDTFDYSSTLKTWIYRITVNKSLDALRARKRLKTWNVFSNLFNDAGEVTYEVAHTDNPSASLEEQERSAVLFEVIKTLPDRQNAVFVLHYIEDLSYKEIAAALEISVSAVDSLMSRAKKQLREKLNRLSYGSIY